MKKEKKLGRVKLICVKEECDNKFSTHSSNRTVCHKCKPKCREIHIFKHNLKGN
jgi:hypothetical protein